MRIKKKIKAHFNSMPIPLAENVLPKDVLADKQPRRSTRLRLKLAIVALCMGAILTSLIIALSKSPEPSLDVSISDNQSQNESVASGVYGDFSNDSSSVTGGIAGESQHVDGREDSMVNNYDSNSEPEPIESEPEPIEPDYEYSKPVDPKPDEPITVYADKIFGEFAGDMYRPEGYDEKIGSALAIMMSMNNDEDTKFNVLVQTYDAIDLKSFLLEYDSSLEVITVEIHGNFAGEGYYVQLTDSQIKELTNCGLKCYYIGSGLGDYRDINWETEEGMRAYCEIWGDMYTFNEREVSLHSGDVFILYFDD